LGDTDIGGYGGHGEQVALLFITVVDNDHQHLLVVRLVDGLVIGESPLRFPLLASNSGSTTMTITIGKSCASATIVLFLGVSLPTVSAIAQSDAGAAAEAATQASSGQSLGIASVPNLRDVGGYKTDDGATVARGLVYRSDQLSGISPDDLEKLAGLDLEVDYNLRTTEERNARPDEVPPGVEYVWLDVLADSPQAGPAQLEKLMKNPKEANAALGGGKVEAGFEQSYREFVSLPSAKREFAKLFVSLGDQKQLPALFHCTTGKDRTGWAAAAMLTLLGVPRDVVMEDYLRSNDYILPAYEEVIDAFVAAGGDPASPPAILGVKREYLEAAFDEMQTQYGSIENYFSEGLGIDAAHQKALRDLYLR
jgi:protein-tyrosine phosphatase